MTDKFRLHGKVAVVIGGAGGIGEACALELSRQGAKVNIASRNLDKLLEVAKNVQSESGSKTEALQVDVSDGQSVNRLAEQVVEKFGTADILVNAHGINVKRPAVEFPVQDWDLLFDVNVKGVMLACQAFGKIMIQNRKGKIINMSSVRGVRGTDRGNEGYGATKGAVDMITRMLAALPTNPWPMIRFRLTRVDRKTLEDAQIHPESHRSLLVRVSGYSAFFIELSGGMQDEIIARTEHNLP